MARRKNDDGVYCGDCLIPTVWSERRKQYVCTRCGS